MQIARNQKKWKIIDNYHEKILCTDFETETSANEFVKDLVKCHKGKKENYDYDVDFINPYIKYGEYISKK